MLLGTLTHCSVVWIKRIRLSALFFFSSIMQMAKEVLKNRLLALMKKPFSCTRLSQVSSASSSGINFPLVDVEHGTQNVVLKVPAVYRAPQFVGNGQNCPVQLVPLLFFLNVCHVSSSFLSLYPVKISFILSHKREYLNSLLNGYRQKIFSAFYSNS